MKKLVIALTAIAALTGPALAADMAVKAPMRAAPPVAYAPSWTGCYVAGGGGYGLFDQENTNFSAGPPRVQASATNHAGGHGGFGTAQVGCDYQFGLAGFNLVVGAFGDYDWDSFKGTHETPFIFGGGRLGAATADEKMSSAWSVGGRLGWVAFPSLLTYFSGGYTEATFNRQDFFVNVPGGSALNFFLDKTTYKGFFIGGGDEYALSFLPGLFWKTEYRLSEFDTKTLPFLNVTTGLATGFEVDSKKWVHTIRSELVYRFNWGGPAVSRY